MSRHSPIRLVAGREISDRLHGRLIYVLTAFSTVIVVIALVVPALVRRQPAPVHVALVGSGAGTLAPLLRAEAPQAGLHLDLLNYPAGSDLSAQLKAGKLAAAVSVDGQVVAEVKESLDPTLGAVIESAAQRQQLALVTEAAGVSPSTLETALAPVPLKTKALVPPLPQTATRDTAAVATGIFLYITLLTYGGAVAGGVAQEKTTRTAEVLVSTLQPDELLTGKVLGIGALGVASTTITIGAGLIANAIVHEAHVSSIIWGLLPGILIWFLIGFAMYSFAFAAAGSLVARQEDAQLVGAPFTVILVGSYLLIFTMLGNPNAGWIKIVSQLPPLAPVLMPARLAVGHVTLWEQALAAVLCLLTTLGTIRLGGRIYREALMHAGPRLGWRAALQLKSGAT
ncbi:MAG TPA: ABC transporter permease [Actinomycetota bacterium]|nr:ABC transporter permease [Actinomycetota bacterium]